MSEVPRPHGVWNDWWSGRRVVFVSGTGGDTRRYRCDYQAEQLRLLGATTDVVAYTPSGTASLPDDLLDTSCIVLHRLEWDERIERLIARARERAVPTVFDTDDLTFDADAAAALSWFVGLDEAGRRTSFELQQKTLVACSAATVSTVVLAEHARRRNPRVTVVPNAIGLEMVREAEAARAAREGVSSPTTTIAYLSGTPTHDRDVLEAAPALLRTLAERPDVRLLVVGYLALDDRFDDLGERLERLPFQPRERLPGILARVDINIAPLEGGNVFSRGKSCLKYLEAGIVGTPTVASAAPDFVRAIGDGDNGILARSEDDWAVGLQSLVDDRGLRTAVGRRAYEDVRARHTTAARAPRLGRSLALLALASAAEGRIYNRARRRAALGTSSPRD